MKKTILFSCAAALLLASCNNNGSPANTTSDTTKVVTTETTKTEEAWVPVDSATTMKAMMEYATPGEMHKMMASWNGNWNDDMTIWEHEGATPQKATGTTVNSMIMSGHYQNSLHKGMMMGMPFEGNGVLGYDNAVKKFVYTWIDNWGTGIIICTGDYDAGTKSLTLTGKAPDVVRPGKFYEMKQVITIVDDNTQKMEMYSPDPKTGKPFKMMEITSTRKK